MPLDVLRALEEGLLSSLLKPQAHRDGVGTGSIADLGVTHDHKTGQLNIDFSQLKTVLENDFESVQDMCDQGARSESDRLTVSLPASSLSTLAKRQKIQISLDENEIYKAMIRVDRASPQAPSSYEIVGKPRGSFVHFEGSDAQEEGRPVRVFEGLTYRFQPDPAVPYFETNVSINDGVMGRVAVLIQEKLDLGVITRARAQAQKEIASLDRQKGIADQTAEQKTDKAHAGEAKFQRGISQTQGIQDLLDGMDRASRR